MISVPSLLALSVNRTESMILQKQSGVRRPSRFGKDPCQSARVQTRLSIDSNGIKFLGQLSTNCKGWFASLLSQRTYNRVLAHLRRYAHKANL